MEEFRILLEIEYKGNRYKVLSNKKFQKYFLKILNDGTLMYPTIQEFQELYKMFQNNSIQSYCPETSDEFKVEEKFQKRKVKLEPKVIWKKTLITLALALTIISNNPKANAINIALSTEQNQTSQTTEYIAGGQIQLEKIKDEVYIVDEWKDNIYCDSIEKFNKYIEIQNPTYDDIRAVLEENGNIAEEYKPIILEGINNLEERLPNMNLSVLYYNLSRMKTIEKKQENIKEDAGENAIAYFSKITGEVVINKDNLDEEVLLHEILGHGSTCAIMQYDNKTLYMGPDLIRYFKEDNETELFGSSLAEAEADMIAKIALGEKIAYRQSYSAISEQLRIFMETSGVDFTTFVNKGTSYLVNEMYKNDIDDPFVYFENCDALRNAMVYALPIEHPKMSVKQNIRNYFEDYSDDKLKRGESVDSITSKIEKIMIGSDFCNIVVFNNDGHAIENVELVDFREEIVTDIKQTQVDKDEER